MSQIEKAVSVRDELLTLWLTILPWRQKNVRECRVCGSERNLFKARFPKHGGLSKPSWIPDNSSDEMEYWQISFSRENTKTKNGVKGILPSDLIELLEEYLLLHRPVLLAGKEDPETLFLDRAGRPLDPKTLTEIVKFRGTQYANMPVTSHLYRDTVAYQWLTENPQDYLTLSKLLWHSNVNVTIKIYGSRFNESTGISKMDDWHAKRKRPACF
jgi:hypothetical protein